MDFLKGFDMHKNIFFFAILIYANAVIAMDNGLKFSVNERKTGVVFYHDYQADAKLIDFTFVPPAKKMFLDTSSNAYLFPPLYKKNEYFHKLIKFPSLLINKTNSEFTAYKIDDKYFILDNKYKLFSATVKGDKLIFSTKNTDGDFVSLNESHFNIYNEEGDLLSVSPTGGIYKNISLLVDRSGSMAGFDSEVSNAIKQFSKLPIIKYYCGIYEFGASIDVIQRPFSVLCNQILLDYKMSAVSGTTPLYGTMEKAYKDLSSKDAVSSLVIISDGSPTDTPSNDLLKLSKKTPTFVLWVGHHDVNYISQYSVAHSVSKSGDAKELTDFFKAVSFSVYSHQAFNINKK